LTISIVTTLHTIAQPEVGFQSYTDSTYLVFVHQCSIFVLLAYRTHLLDNRQLWGGQERIRKSEQRRLTKTKNGPISFM